MTAIFFIRLNIPPEEGGQERANDKLRGVNKKEWSRVEGKGGRGFEDGLRSRKKGIKKDSGKRGKREGVSEDVSA